MSVVQSQRGWVDHMWDIQVIFLSGVSGENTTLCLKKKKKTEFWYNWSIGPHSQRHQVSDYSSHFAATSVSHLESLVKTIS